MKPGRYNKSFPANDENSIWDVVRKSFFLHPKDDNRGNQGHLSIIWGLKTISFYYLCWFTLKPGRYDKSFPPNDENSIVTTSGIQPFLLSMALFEKTKVFIRFHFYQRLLGYIVSLLRRREGRRSILCVGLLSIAKLSVLWRLPRDQ